MDDAEQIELRSTFTHRGYLTAVARVREYVLAGDIFQANLSQRFEAPLRESPWSLYRRLRATNPAAFGAFMDCGDFQVLSVSPERFLRLSGTHVETRPIKGTRPRGLGPMHDAMLGRVLSESDKDRAANEKLLLERINRDEAEFRSGFDGMLAGYLLLTREKGLKFVEQRFFADGKARHGDVRHAASALRFYFEYGPKKLRDDVMAEVQRQFRPEFLNRVDELIVFNSLTEADLRRIVDIQLREVLQRARERGMTLVVDVKATRFLIRKGFNSDYGARPLRRAIERFVEDPLAEEVLKLGDGTASTVYVTVLGEVEKAEKLTFSNERPAEEAQPVEAGASAQK